MKQRLVREQYSEKQKEERQITKKREKVHPELIFELGEV
jgi:hypothetical protein